MNARSEARLTVLLVAALAMGACTSNARAADDVETKVQAAANHLKSKAREVQTTLRNALGQPFEEQIEAALKQLEAEPRSLSQQVKVADGMLAWTEKLSKTLHSAKAAGLPGLRDRVVQGLQALAEAQRANAERLRTRAQGDEKAHAERFLRLAEMCDRFARA